MKDEVRRADRAAVFVDLASDTLMSFPSSFRLHP
jgi:hypothetical protein